MEIPQALSDFSFVLVYLVAAGLFAVGPLVIAKLIGPKSFGPARDAIYECGMPTIGSAWIQVAVIYYLFALLFKIICKLPGECCFTGTLETRN